jgi:hypothetical protein
MVLYWIKPPQTPRLYRRWAPTGRFSSAWARLHLEEVESLSNEVLFHHNGEIHFLFLVDPRQVLWNSLVDVFPSMAGITKNGFAK